MMSQTTAFPNNSPGGDTKVRKLTQHHSQAKAKENKMNIPQNDIGRQDLIFMKSLKQGLFVPSLIIKERPQQTLAMLIYLKKFSEMLLSWDQKSKAIQISKIISRSYELFENMTRKSNFSSHSPRQPSATSESNHNILTKYLLYSEHSLHQEHHQNVFLDNMVPCPDCTDTVNERQIQTLECQICNLTVRGLAFQCIECGHGGHRTHIEKWIQQQVS